MPCDLATVIEIARRHHVPVIEDAACAAGSEIEYRGRWERIGRPHGDVACFSFHPRKVLTTGDGGMLTTANPEWDRQFRLWRQHAMSVSDQARHSSREVVSEQYTELGYNYRLTDLQAAIGRVQLTRLPATVARRREIAARYHALLRGIPGLHLPFEPAWARSNWQSYCVRLPHGVDQSRVMQSMLDEGISTRRGVMCAHLEPAYRREPWRAQSSSALAVSERISADGLILPLYVDMTEAEESRVVSSLERALAREEQKP